MNMVELLQVTETFKVPSLGLLLMPDFSVPSAGWNCTMTDVELVTPGGHIVATRAKFSQIHFNMPDPSVSADRRWRVVASLPDLSESQVPIGTRLVVPSAFRAQLLPQV
jgi:hypothetical protein